MNATNPPIQDHNHKNNNKNNHKNNQNQPKKVAIFLYNMGGPQTTSDVAPFLTELFRDNDLLALPLAGLTQNFVAQKIVSKRTGDIQKKYDEIGGGSPQLAITQSLSNKIFKSLQAASAEMHHERTFFEFIHVGPLMRYTNPRAEASLNQALSQGAEEIWFLTQYPQCARATTGTSLREIGRLCAKLPALKEVTLRNFARYGDDPDYHALWKERIAKSWASLSPGKKHLIVSAHNLPVSYIAEGDPYRMQIYDTARQTLRLLGLTEGADWTLAWQSAVGPVKWMNPDTRDVIKNCAAKGKSELLIWPVAFVSDHIETLHEIDIEFAEIAHHEGIQVFSRVPNLNDSEDFSQYLVKRILDGAREVAQTGESLKLRNLKTHPSGEGCHMQPGGCLCGKYFVSGQKGLERGTVNCRLPPAKIGMR